MPAGLLESAASRSMVPSSIAPARMSDGRRRTFAADLEYTEANQVGS
jgi:hypothetical protein